MKKSTIVLTTLTAALALAGKSGFAQTASDIDNKGYDSSIVSWALSTTSSDEQAILDALNAARTAKGLPAFTLDPALVAPARYQIMDEFKLGYVGNFAFLADQATQVDPVTLASDFGASPTGVGNSVFGNYSYIYDSPTVTGSWTALVSDWVRRDYAMKLIFADPTVTRIGIGLVSTGRNIPTAVGPIPVYRWAALTGK